MEINNAVVAKALSGNKKDAKTLASDAALEQLRKECYTLKVSSMNKFCLEFQLNNRKLKQFKRKPEVKSTKIETTMGPSNKKLLDSTTNNDEYSKNQLNENNKGFKMMKLLGWSGGALSAGGIETPIG